MLRFTSELQANPVSTIADNLSHLQDRIAHAAAKSSRKPEDITLIGVSKIIQPNQFAKPMPLVFVTLAKIAFKNGKASASNLPTSPPNSLPI